MIRDPRLQRTFAVIDEVFADEVGDMWGFASLLWEVVGRHLLEVDGIKHALSTLVAAQPRDIDRNAALDEMVAIAIAEREHRHTCACCRARTQAEAS